MYIYTPRGLYVDPKNPIISKVVDFFGCTEHYIQYITGKFNQPEAVKKFTTNMDIEDMFSELKSLPEEYKWELYPEDLRIAFISMGSVFEDLKDEVPEILNLPVYDALAFTDNEGTPIIAVNVDNIDGKRTDIYESTMAHELVHIHQFQRGDLKLVEGQIYWKGELWDFDRIQEHTAVHSMNRVVTGDVHLDQLGRESTLPWELEAYGATLPEVRETHIAYGLIQQIKAEWVSAKNK